MVLFQGGAFQSGLSFATVASSALCARGTTRGHTHTHNPTIMSGITKSAESFLKSVLDVITKAGVDEEKIEMMRPELSELVEDFTQRMNRVEEEVRLQKEMMNKLIQRIGFLERRVKQSVTAERRRDYNQVRNNLLVRTKRTIPEIRKFLTNAVELGGGVKVTQTSLPVVELPPAPGKTRDVKLFRVLLGDGQKASLFKGLAKAALPDEATIRVDHEVPYYLIQTKRQMERIAFSLRQKFKASHQLKTKIVFSSFKLRLRIRDKENASWINIDDAKASMYMDAEVLFKPEEVPATGIPTVRQYYTDTLAALD